MLEKLRKLSIEGLEKKYNFSANSADLSDEQSCLKFRLEYELDLIEENNLIDYFMKLYNITIFAKENNIPYIFFPTTLSSSLVGYCINITPFDPIEYGLIFETCLNVSYMPARFCVQDTETKLINLIKDNAIDIQVFSKQNNELSLGDNEIFEQEFLYSKIPLDNKKVYNDIIKHNPFSHLLCNKDKENNQELINKCNDLLKEYHPENFQELMNVFSAYKKNKDQDKSLESLIAGKKGTKQYDLIYNPLFKDILAETNGIILYVEQCIEIIKITLDTSYADAAKRGHAMLSEVSGFIKSLDLQRLSSIKKNKSI